MKAMFSECSFLLASTATTAPVATTRTKFCPVGGELYSEDIKYCPTHGVELRYKE